MLIGDKRSQFGVVPPKTGHNPERTKIHTTGFLGKTKSQHTLSIYLNCIHQLCFFLKIVHLEQCYPGIARCGGPLLVIFLFITCS